MVRSAVHAAGAPSVGVAGGMVSCQRTKMTFCGSTGVAGLPEMVVGPNGTFTTCGATVTSPVGIGVCGTYAPGTPVPKPGVAAGSWCSTSPAANCIEQPEKAPLTEKATPLNALASIQLGK